jgi:hypothetical protein
MIIPFRLFEEKRLKEGGFAELSANPLNLIIV